MISVSIASAFLLLIGLAQCQEQKVRFCAPQPSLSKCSQMASEIDFVECVPRVDALSCLEAIAADEADTMSLNAANIFVAAKHFNVSILAYEEVNGEPYFYRSVALVSKSSEISSLSDLKGAKSCHTGVGRTAGWQIPIAKLQSLGIMRRDCRGELQTIANFFNASCAPGAWSNDPIIDAELKRKYPSLCSLCENPEQCSRADAYSGYEGALKCLEDERGDVAFSKTDAVEVYLQKNPSFSEGFEYLCSDNTRRGLREGADRQCSWGVRPSNAFVVCSHNTPEKREAIYSSIKQIFARYPSNIPQLQNQQRPEWFTSFFVSKNTTDVIKASPELQDPSAYLGDFTKTMERNREECPPKLVRFCTTSEQGINKCNDLAKMTCSRRIERKVGCILENTIADCIAAVKDGRADVITLDGGDIYRAGRYSDLVPIASELYGLEDATYYSVAIISADSTINSLEGLRGLKSCHTGIDRTAGWVMPIGSLTSKNLIPKTECDKAAAVSDFFSASCAPGANDPRYNPSGSGAVKLCQQCIGDENGENVCSRGSAERYSGYAGSFRCLVENSGDVAFAKHTTVSEYTNGNSDLNWTKSLRSEDYKLLCQNGGTADVSNYKSCNLGRVPSHNVMISGSATPEERLEIAEFIIAVNKWFGNSSSNFNVFKPYGGKTDLLFKDSTTALKAVPLNADYKEVLGEDYLNAVESTDPLLCLQES